MGERKHGLLFGVHSWHHGLTQKKNGTENESLISELKEIERKDGTQRRTQIDFFPQTTIDLKLRWRRPERRLCGYIARGTVRSTPTVENFSFFCSQAIKIKFPWKRRQFRISIKYIIINRNNCFQCESDYAHQNDANRPWHRWRHSATWLTNALTLHRMCLSK